MWERNWNVVISFFFFFSSKYPFSLSQYGRRFAQTQHWLRLFFGLSPHLQKGSLFLLAFTCLQCNSMSSFRMPFLIFFDCGKPSFILPFSIMFCFRFSSASIIQCLVFWSLRDFTFGNFWCFIIFRFYAFCSLFPRGLNVSIGTMRLRGLTLGIAGTGYLANAWIQRVLLDTLWVFLIIIYFMSWIEGSPAFFTSHLLFNLLLKWNTDIMDSICTCVVE